MTEDKSTRHPYVGFENGGGRRRDYGPKGCAGIVFAPVLLAAAVTVALLMSGCVPTDTTPVVPVEAPPPVPAPTPPPAGDR